MRIPSNEADKDILRRQSAFMVFRSDAVEEDPAFGNYFDMLIATVNMRQEKRQLALQERLQQLVDRENKVQQDGEVSDDEEEEHMDYDGESEGDDEDDVTYSTDEDEKDQEPSADHELPFGSLDAWAADHHLHVVKLLREWRQDLPTVAFQTVCGFPRPLTDIVLGYCYCETPDDEDCDL